MKLYLAYGMNTNTGEMARRCPAAKYICNIVLKDHQLVFRGVADVVPTKGKKVECALWMITPECEAALDRLEGFPNFYVKKYITTTLDGRRNRMMLYIMRRQHVSDQHRAYVSYYQCLVNGYEACGLPRDQIEDAMQRAKDVEVQRADDTFVSRQRATPMKQRGNSKIVAQLPIPFGSTVPNYVREHGLFKNLRHSLRPVETNDDEDARFNELFEQSERN